MNPKSLKRYERAQKPQTKPNITTSKFFTAPYTCNNLRMSSLQYFHIFIIFRNYFPYLVYSTFKILISNLDRKGFDF